MGHTARMMAAAMRTRSDWSGRDPWDRFVLESAVLAGESGTVTW